MFDLEWKIRDKDIFVCLKGAPTMFATGKSLNDAIGNWVRTYGHKMEIRLEQRQ